jgi:hypothetical protein
VGAITSFTRLREERELLQWSRQLIDDLQRVFMGITRDMLAGGAGANGPGNVAKPVNPAFNSGSLYDQWVQVDTLQNITTRGGPVLLLANHGLSHVSLSTTSIRVSFQWRRNGTQVAVDFATRVGQAGYIPLPWPVIVDTPGAGTWSYTFWVYIESGASSSVIHSGFNSMLQAMEIG